MRLLPVVIGILLLLPSFDSARGFYASLTASAKAIERGIDSSLGKDGVRVFEDQRMAHVDAKILVFKNEGRPVHVRCYFFARESGNNKQPYLLDEQEQVVYGSETIEFSSPIVNVSETHSNEQSFRGNAWLDGRLIPIDGTIGSSLTYKGDRIHGWVVTTTVDGVIEQVESNQRDIRLDFERKARESRQSRSKSSAGVSSNSSRRPPPSQNSEPITEDVALLNGERYFTQLGTTKRVLIPSRTEVKIHARNGEWYHVYLDNMNVEEVSRSALLIAPKVKSTQPDLDTATLLQEVKFTLKKNGVKTGQTAAPAGAKVKVLETVNGRSRVQFGTTEPSWLDESQLAKE